MLVARRDPPFESGAHGVSSPAGPQGATHTPRFMTALQVIGSLLAIPVGLASAYSIYYSNFSAAAQCQGLRANIVSMLDKSVDASTLRMLVRRDVMAFEHSCGAVDPDAVAAFRKLLAAGKSATPQAQPTPEPASRQSAAAKAAPEKLPPAAADAKPARQATDVKPVRRDTEIKPTRRDADAKPAVHEQAASDVQWLEAVRGALVHTPATPVAIKEKVAAPARPLGELPAQAAAPTVASAPALAPATSVTAAPAPATDNDHPVPPASIPDAAVSEATAALPATKPERSRLKALIADIPLLGRMVDR
jgi:hypothetical protein